MWLRYVKWNVLAAREVAKDRGLFTVISWGWGTFGPESVDADKPATACVYLWARDKTICDGPAAGGLAFKASLTEGQIVLPPGRQCTFAGGPILTSQVDGLARVTGDRRAALDALFARSLLKAVKVNEQDVIAREQQVIDTRFGGKRAAYERALAVKGATVAIARAIIRDDQRRRAYAARLEEGGSTQTPLEALADRSTAVLAGATCLLDDLPGFGGSRKATPAILSSPRPPARCRSCSATRPPRRGLGA